MSEPDSLVDLKQIVQSMGDAGRRLSEIDAGEGAAGNLSICIRAQVRPHPEFAHSETIELPVPVPDIAGATLVVTGSGSRLRDIREDPTACLGCLEVQPGGIKATLRYSSRRNFARLTSEFNSHLAVHYDQCLRAGATVHAVVHGQPRRLTYLSHIAEYQNSEYLNRRLLRWQPEAILNLPEGIAVVPFIVPGTNELMDANVNALREHKVAIWSKHGLMARSSISVMAAVDLVEYVETAAVYECLDLSLGQRAQGLFDNEIRDICCAYEIEQDLF
jgi:rhamnulose-1-phosphate aldolase